MKEGKIVEYVCRTFINGLGETGFEITAERSFFNTPGYLDRVKDDLRKHIVLETHMESLNNHDKGVS